MSSMTSSKLTFPVCPLSMRLKRAWTSRSEMPGCPERSSAASSSTSSMPSPPASSSMYFSLRCSASTASRPEAAPRRPKGELGHLGEPRCPTLLHLRTSRLELRRPTVRGTTRGSPFGVQVRLSVSDRPSGPLNFSSSFPLIVLLRLALQSAAPSSVTNANCPVVFGSPHATNRIFLPPVSPTNVACPSASISTMPSSTPSLTATHLPASVANIVRSRRQVEGCAG
mmetsp:Transcript_46342/g.131041  ORF Transcript_46342/g.131041 Transcript_46342/m.131041 type:complete len:226 (-) Transcript_46342:18-695(-)